MNYYEKVRDAVERIAECTTSDAQGVVEAWERTNGPVEEQQWGGEPDAENVARAILKMPKGKNWYHKEGRAPHFQGHVIDEATGADIAVTYNDEGGKHARLMAQAPALLEAVQAVLSSPCPEVVYKWLEVHGLTDKLQAARDAATNP